MGKKIIAILAAAVLLTGAAACGKREQKYRSDRTQVFVSLFSGGFGNEWLQNAATSFNEQSDEFEVILSDPNKDSYSQISAAITSGTSRYDIYFNSTPDFIDLARQGYLEPLNDVLDMKPDGENGMTVREKIKDGDQFIRAFSYEENGTLNTYALPFTDAMQGFVYDHELFVQQGWLLTEADGKTLTAGRDGKPGTYDDGQPQTIAEWDEMIQNIAGGSVARPFIWTGKFTDYLVSMSEAVWAQYDGLKNYEISFGYDGKYVAPSDGTETTVTPDKGYLTYEAMEGRLKALEFVDEYLTNHENYRHPTCTNGDKSYADAQFDFITGYKNIPGNPRSAMIYEGVWWENEAKSKFNALAGAGDASMAYGNHEYRYMLFPHYENSYGLDGEGGGSVMPISESANVFIKKQTNDTVRRGAKEFLAYTCSDEVLKEFTLCSGGMRPYKYTLTEEELAKLTKFQRNAYALYTDTENVSLVRPGILKYRSMMNYFITPAANRWGAKVGDITYGEAYVGLKQTDAQTYFEQIVAMTPASKWASDIYGRLPA